MSEKREAEFTRVENTEGAEQRSLGHLAAQAVEGGLLGASLKVGALAAQDGYEKVKGALQSEDAPSSIVLPPGLKVDED